MFRYFAIVAFVASCYSAVALGEPVYADNELLQQQKIVYDLLSHIDQADIVHPQFYKTATEFDVDAYLSSLEYARDFYQLWKYGNVLPRGEIFSIFYPSHVEEVKALFKVFFYAKDFETLLKIAAWARVHVNECLFAYTFCVAVHHHPQLKNIRVPPHNELYPYLYFNSEVLEKAKSVKIHHDLSTAHVAVDGAIIIPANHSNWYLNYESDDEYKMNYYTEDQSLAALNWYSHLTHPFWLAFEEFGLELRNPGEIYIWAIQLQLARAELERRSLGMGEVKRINWYRPVQIGYHPTLTFHNGLPLPHREEGSEISSFYLDQILSCEYRISEAIDLGYFRNTSGQLEFFRNQEGIDILGRMIAGYSGPANPSYYRRYEVISRSALGFSPKTFDESKVVPSILEYYGPAQRDPIYWSWSTRMLGFYKEFIAHLPKYSWKELIYNDVEIVSAEVDGITTFLDYVDIPITNGVKVRDANDKTVIKARQLRLNHKPFVYRYNFKANSDSRICTRVFIGPTEDSHGAPLDITKNWKNFILLDFFTKELKSGTNKFERSSTKAENAANVGLYDEDFYQKVVDALAGKRKLEIPKQFYGYPEHLTIPRGTPGGMKFRFLFFINKCDEKQFVHHRSRLIGEKLYDDQPQGWPLERPPIANFTLLPNVHVEDVVITHKEFRDINRTT